MPPLPHWAYFAREIAMRMALFQPEIPGNVGAILRLCACFGVDVDIIEPCGFLWSDSRVRRAGMDYIDHVNITRHADWDAFQAIPGRRILLTTKAEASVFDFAFEPDDILLMGQESAGAPAYVHAACEYRIKIPLRTVVRSFNVATAAGIVLAEALRQTGQLPQD